MAKFTSLTNYIFKNKSTALEDYKKLILDKNKNYFKELEEKYKDVIGTIKKITSEEGIKLFVKDNDSEEIKKEKILLITYIGTADDAKDFVKESSNNILERMLSAAAKSKKSIKLEDVKVFKKLSQESNEQGKDDKPDKSDDTTSNDTSQKTQGGDSNDKQDSDVSSDSTDSSGSDDSSGSGDSDGSSDSSGSDSDDKNDAKPKKKKKFIGKTEDEDEDEDYPSPLSFHKKLIEYKKEKLEELEQIYSDQVQKKGGKSNKFIEGAYKKAQQNIEDIFRENEVDSLLKNSLETKFQDNTDSSNLRKISTEANRIFRETKLQTHNVVSRYKIKYLAGAPTIVAKKIGEIGKGIGSALKSVASSKLGKSTAKATSNAIENVKKNSQLNRIRKEGEEIGNELGPEKRAQYINFQKANQSEEADKIYQEVLKNRQDAKMEDKEINPQKITSNIEFIKTNLGQGEANEFRDLMRQGTTESRDKARAIFQAAEAKKAKKPTGFKAVGNALRKVGAKMNNTPSAQ